MSRSQPLVWLALVLLAGTGCEDQPTAAPEQEDAPLSAKTVPKPPGQNLTSDDEYARVARAEVPGFAGVYLDDEGTPVILLKDHRQAAAAERYLAPQLARALRGRNAVGARKPIIRKVAHDFADLKEWFDRLYGLMPREDVYMLDIDEKGNRVTIGVRDDAAIKVLRREAARLGVPPGHLNIRIEAPGELRQTYPSLTSWTPTLMGGYQIATADPPDDRTGVCTLGFNAIHQGLQIFVTNSHCTYTAFGNDGGLFTQPTYVSGNEIGYEYRDQAMYACAGVGTSCRYSDAAYVTVNSKRTFGLGKIAYTQYGFNAPAPNLEVIGVWDVVERLAGPIMEGEELDKTGRTTGSTYGKIHEPCVTRWALGNPAYEIRCTDTATIYSSGGDSGSPVFKYLGGEVALYGILFGGPKGQPNVSWISRLANIEHDLGVLSSVCVPDAGC